MARKPKRSDPVRVVRAKGDDLPTVAIDAGQVRAILDFRVIEADGKVFGTGQFQGDHRHHRDTLPGLADAVAPAFRALLQAVADHLGGEVVDIGTLDRLPQGGPPTVAASRGGRA